MKEKNFETPVVLVGAGGHGKVLLNILQLRKHNIIGIVERDIEKHGGRLKDVPIVGDDKYVFKWNYEDIVLVNGIGSVKDMTARTELYQYFADRRYGFLTLIHPRAIVADDVLIGAGVQVMAGAIVQPGCQIGCNSIINSGAILEHDCRIESHVHVAPGAALSGNVSVGQGSHVGVGAVVIQGVHIGERCVIAAGAVVIRDVAPGKCVMGVPAK
nr:acetyltransferase [uncultured Anaeromusa sp.]